MKTFRHFLMTAGLLLLAQCGFKKSKENLTGQILINHLGYDTQGSKRFVFQTKESHAPESFSLVDQDGELVFEGTFKNGGPIDQWHTGNGFAGAFSSFNVPGYYRIELNYLDKSYLSEYFSIAQQQIAQSTLSLLIQGIHSQRTSGVYSETDQEMRFFGDRADVVDVSGGWYDASGDRSKYLSHLSYANFMNPQQAPMVVWNFVEAAHRLTNYRSEDAVEMRQKMLGEALHGADWLVKMQDAAGYFYLNVFDNWSWDPEKREICAYIGQEGYKNDHYQAGYREGGGMSIAALARVVGDQLGGSSASNQYLSAAIKGFEHLEENNLKYIANGEENIIDDYCALMAATELFYATDDDKYLHAARKRMHQLTRRLSNDENARGFWLADSATNRPYFHAAEAGLPIISLVRYLSMETKQAYRNRAIEAIRAAVDFELEITGEVNNPFGYARQYVKATNEISNRTAFFIPQNNETGYWWQGENARIASLSAAMRFALPYLESNKEEEVLAYATNQINWILGLNPYDICMLDGRGRNNPQYAEGDKEMNVTGCVSNGVTAGFGNESDIAFYPDPYRNDPSHKWRWGEQWLQHGSWLMLAISTSLN